MTCSLVPFFTKLGTLTSFSTTEVVPEIEKDWLVIFSQDVLLCSRFYSSAVKPFPNLNFKLTFGFFFMPPIQIRFRWRSFAYGTVNGLLYNKQNFVTMF